MVLKYSYDHPLGWQLPSFVLPDSQGRAYTEKDLMGPKGLLLIFGCNHCPYMKAQWGRIVSAAKLAAEHGIHSVAINSNINPDYPDDAVEKMPQVILDEGIDFPYLVDSTQDVARGFKAQCTPDPFLFDGEGRLVYHGRIDDNWQDAGAVTMQDLQQAIEALAAGGKPGTEQHPSMGCSIKWRNE